jgi:hypothetical protein
MRMSGSRRGREEICPEPGSKASFLISDNSTIGYLYREGARWGRAPGKEGTKVNFT